MPALISTLPFRVMAERKPAAATVGPTSAPARAADDLVKCPEPRITPDEVTGRPITFTRGTDSCNPKLCLRAAVPPSKQTLPWPKY